MAQASLSRQDHYHHVFLYLKGSWTVATLKNVESEIQALNPHDLVDITFDFKEFEGADVSGAWIIHELIETCKALKVGVHFNGIPKSLSELFSFLPSVSEPKRKAHKYTALELVRAIGHQSIVLWENALKFIAFVGEFIIHFGSGCLNPHRFHWVSLAHHIYKVGVTSLPIVGLISFLIGIVLVYQGATQLKRFGAEIFTVDLLAVSVLREIGILMTAIIVAGRSGSAFTAEIGYMSLNQEVDALKVMGFHTQPMLVMPRVLALIICLPLLGFYADIMGLIGGALMCSYYIDIHSHEFIHQLSLGFKPSFFWVGLIKAPFFAAAIGLIGCYEGLNVHGGAEKVGSQTTKSVVEGIFMVIVLDAFFSIFFSLIGL